MLCLQIYYEGVEIVLQDPLDVQRLLFVSEQKSHFQVVFDQLCINQYSIN